MSNTDSVGSTYIPKAIIFILTKYGISLVMFKNLVQ